jgi:hypothetical protein
MKSTGLSERKRTAIAILKGGGVWTPKELAKVMGITAKKASLYLRSLDGKEAVRLGQGLYRSSEVEDVLKGRIKSVELGIHGLSFKGHKPEKWSAEDPTPWVRFTAPPKDGRDYNSETVTLTLKELRSIEFRYYPNGTLMVYVNSTTDNPLTVEEYFSVLGAIEAHLGPTVHALGLCVSEIGLNCDLGEWHICQGGDNKEVTLSPWGLGGLLLRAYEHKGRGLRFEAHCSKELTLSEVARVLRIMGGGQP